jgi:AI-2 transport system permease protein
MKLNWESALLALLVLEILLFGAMNPRMLDINMLLFSTSDFICIGIVALPLTLVIISGGIDISLGSTIGLCAIALGVMMQAGWPMARDSADAAARPAVRAGERGADSLHRHQPAGDYPRHAVSLRRRRAAAFGMAGATGYEGIGGFPDSFTAFANLTLLACRCRWCCSPLSPFSSGC